MDRKRLFKAKDRRITRGYNKSTEEEKFRKRTIFFGGLTLLLGLAIVVWGIPFFIRLAELLDEKKNVSDSQVLNEDLIPPVPPRFAYVPEATNSASIPLIGYSEKNSSVEVFLNDELAVKTEADEEGEFNIEKIFLDPGENSLYSYAIDESGNTSDKSGLYSIIFDNIKPELEIEAPSGNETVYEQNLQIKGKSEPNARITVNGSLVLPDSDGNFIFDYELATDKNEISIIAQDSAGNVVSKNFTITYHP